MCQKTRGREKVEGDKEGRREKVRGRGSKSDGDIGGWSKAWGKGRCQPQKGEILFLYLKVPRGGLRKFWRGFGGLRKKIGGNHGRWSQIFQKSRRQGHVNSVSVFNVMQLHFHTEDLRSVNFGVKVNCHS